MKYLLSIIISLFTFSANAELNCLLPENIFGEACEKEREELEKNKKQGYLEEEYLEDEWTVSVVQHEGKDTSDWGINASVNGRVTHGDRFRVRILPRDLNLCNNGNLITTFYTHIINKKTLEFSDLVIPALFNNQKINVQILFAQKFLMGYSVTIDLGWNELKNIKDFFKNEKEVSLQLLDSEKIKVEDYFDIVENTFSLTGLNDALDRAKNECIRIVNERNG